MSNIIKDLMTAARRLLSNWPLIGALVLLFDGLLAASYLFVSTREATPLQLLLTVVMAIVVLILFFMIQWLGVSYAVGERSAGQLLRGSLRGLWKVAAVTLPVALIGVALIYLFAKIDPGPQSWGAEGGVPWKSLTLTALQYLIFAFALPLMAIHLWIAVSSSLTAKTFTSAIANAFSPRAVGVYLIGFLVFAVLPYFLLKTRTPISNAWLEIVLLGLRLALAFILVLFGWLATLGALRLKSSPELAVAVNREAVL